MPVQIGMGYEVPYFPRSLLLSVILKPIGQDQPGRIIGWCFEDATMEG
jgi:hypothetical protein